jgi:hypothetical protein
LDREKLMKQIQPGSLHVVVAGRLDGTVGFLYTRNPLDWLATLGNHFELGEIEVRASAAAEKIVRYLRSRFSVAHIPNERMPWYLVDYPQAVQALDEIDLDTGEPTSGLELGAKVQVDPGRRRGSVFGFTRSGRVVVKLDGLTFTENIVIAPRENVKRIVRVAAISTGGEG